MSIDRLTLDESTSNYTESSMLAGIPDEELLCPVSYTHLTLPTKA